MYVIRCVNMIQRYARYLALIAVLTMIVLFAVFRVSEIQMQVSHCYVIVLNKDFIHSFVVLRAVVLIHQNDHLLYFTRTALQQKLLITEFPVSYFCHAVFHQSVSYSMTCFKQQLVFA